LLHIHLNPSCPTHPPNSKTMKRKTLWGILALALLAACDSAKVFEDHQTMDQAMWEQPMGLMFSPVLEKAGAYELSIVLRHVEGFPNERVPILLRHTAPSGADSSFAEMLEVRDASGYLGSGMGDIWDLEQVIVPRLEIGEPGKQAFQLYHASDSPALLGVMEVGLKIRAVE